MHNNKLWRPLLKLEKESWKILILGENQTMAQKQCYILKIVLNKKVIFNNKNLN